MERVENVITFEDTLKFCKANDRLKESVRKSTNAQKLFLETDIIEKQNKDLYETPAKVLVSRRRSLEAAKAYKGNKIAVHNFASATNPGGGVVRGSNAQEECLCSSKLENKKQQPV